VFEKSSGGASAGRFRWVEVAAVRRVCERLVGRGGVGRGVGYTASRSVDRGAVGDTGQGASDDDDDDGGDDGRDDDVSVAMVDVETNGGTPTAGTPGNARRRAVVLACGSLSPPTYAHLRLLEVARDALRERGWAADRGVLSPVHGAYAKPGLPAGYHRLAMARLAVAEAPGGWVRAGEFEMQRGKYSASWEVVDWARAEVGGGDFEVVFACGGDLFEAMCDEERWPPANVRKLLGRAFVAVVSRPGSDARDCLQNHVFAGLRDRVWFCDAVESGVSSSAVRELLAAGRSVQYLIPPAVESYVRDHGLYGCAGAPAANGTAAKPNGKS
jgi:nicotinamide mononucleotide adenylyltransferase